MIKKIQLLALMALIIATISCSKDTKPEYEGINKIYLSTENDAVIIENEDRSIEVTVDLTLATKEDITLNFEILDDTKEILKLEGNPVKIKAGVKTASFKILSNKKEILNQETYFKVGIKTFPNNMALNEVLKVKVKPNPVIPELSEIQRNYIAGYKEKFGIDLNKIIGLIPYKLSIKYPGNGTLTPFINEYTKEYEGKTLITLSKNATADKPIIEMLDNPLGLSEYLYKILRQETVEESEFKCPGQSPKTAYECMLEAIKFTKESKEEFKLSLDNIEIETAKTPNNIKFTGLVENTYGDLENIGIPFKYSFSAWDRLKKLKDEGKTITIESGEGGKPQEVLASTLVINGITVKPKVFLFYSTIDKDDWSNEPSDWIEPKANLDLKSGKMNFTFPMDHFSAGGYTQVSIEYLIEK